MSTRQRGAALLAAMLTVTLVATFAAAALWQQWRSIEVETAERARVQSAWILLGALDWSRLILIEDGRAGGADHLAEPWAVPLEEARLSTFLAADRNVAQQTDASTDTRDAFLSGQIIDLQSRLNLTNLVQGGTVNESALAQFGRLFNQLGLPASELATLVQGLRAAQAPAESGSQAPLMPQTLGQLTWLGVSPATVAVLAPHAALVAVREMQHFKTLEDVNALLGQVTRVSSNDHAVSSSYFEVHGRLRLDDVTVQERSMVRRLGLEVTTVWRERGAALRSNPTMARENRP